MKAPLHAVAIMLVALSGCVTLPDPVPEAYLAGTSAEQARTIEGLEKTAIAKNQAVRVRKDRESEAERILKVEEGRLSIMKEEKRLLEEKQRQYQLEEDAKKIEENAKLMAEKDAQVASQAARVEYSAARVELARAEREVADAELAVAVAELNYEKAKIARDFLVAQGTGAEGVKKGPFAEKPEDFDRPYRKFLEKQRSILVKKNAAREEASVKVKIADEKMQ